MMDGLKIIKTIHTTDRFEAYEADLKGSRVFAKNAKTVKTSELLARVPENSAIANRIGSKTDFKFRAPKIITEEADWLVTEWIEGQSLAQKVENHLDAVADVLANFLLVLDQEPVTNHEIRKTFGKDSLSVYMKEKLPKNLSPGQNKILADSKKLFDQLQATLATSWQDGDVKPEHIFIDPQDPYGFVLIDPEHLDQRWPRFYSLANNFAKYWVRGPKQFSIVLAELFMSKSGISEEEIIKPLLACIIVRGISLHWEPDYDPGAENYNIPRAQEMLRACLKARNIEDLLY